jgi:hypothetical protein
MATLLSTERLAARAPAVDQIELPAPTAWPLVLAFGSTLLFAGLLTSVSVSILGAVLAVAGCVGWFREVLPREHEEPVPVLRDDLQVATTRRLVERLPVATDQLRAWLPVQTYPISAGIKGGLAGSVAMAILACGYGLLTFGSIWYPINLLAAAVYAGAATLQPDALHTFHAVSFAIACGLHGLVSTLVGLLYGAMLPMLARRPIVLGGLIGPVLWSGLIFLILGILNPLLESRIDWYWFVASQVAFGLVAGLVVARHTRTPTRENIPFILRAGVEAAGTMAPRRPGETGR